MKAIFKFFIILSLLISNLNAQVTLNESFNKDLTYQNDYGVAFFHTARPTDNTIFIYNEDLTLYKNIVTTPPNGYRLRSVTTFSKTVFNNDDKVEFLVTFSEINTDSDKNNNEVTMLYNENNTMLYDFGYSASNFIYMIKTSNDNHKVVIRKFFYDENYTISYGTDVYSVTPSLSSTSTTALKKVNSRAYPNPAKNKINLSYKSDNLAADTLTIYNSSGQRIESHKINTKNTNYILDISKYASGTYIYQVGAYSNKFIVR